MQSLFNKEYSQEFIARINNLNTGTQANWGKMIVAQMLNHCQTPRNMTSGELKAKPNPLIKFIFGRSAKRQLVSDPEFKKNCLLFVQPKC